uniref:Uncharacterized protein n=1 Tax=Schlesneria paludicola TaxID=360056 RepID=A0A7C4QND6_9PLAN
MSEFSFARAREQFQTHGAEALFELLCQDLRARHDFHKLFDALCLRKKYALGLPLGRPTAFDDVPASLRDEFESAYVAAAREVGHLLLADGKIPQAWMYFHAIRETQPIREALDRYPIPRESTEESEELIDLALYKGVHPVKGVEIQLRTHGTCSTITALDQMFPRLNPSDRAACAAVLVRSLHADVLQSVQRDVAQRMPFAPPAATLRELIAGREWLFADNNYHIDCSHLHSVVRFARSLSPEAPELALARDLAEYGAQLAPQFQYAGEPPFRDFYPAHIEFFKFLLREDSDRALHYFRGQLERETEDMDRALTAYVMVDLLVRMGRFADALPIAERHLLNADAEFATAFGELCEKAGRFDVLQRVSEARHDPVTFTAALLQEQAARPVAQGSAAG